jgi:hypothetical protein
VLRDGQSIQVAVTLGVHPTSQINTDSSIG